MTDLAWMKVYIGTETALTSHLTAEEFGAYERLRRHYWQHGSLPEDDIARLQRISGIEPDRWPAIASAIGLLMADALAKLDHARTDAADKREKKMAAGRKGALSRWSNGPENGNTIADANSKSMAEPMRLPSVCQWPSASASEEEGLGGKVSSTHAPARETETSEFPIDPPEDVETAKTILEERGVPPEHMDAALTKLMAFRLYPSDLARYAP